MEITAELRAALDANPEAQARFESMSPSHQREFASHVAEGVKPETRVRRADKMVDLILQSGDGA